jgi:energy-coupling factor transporter ATP-binding protein EcfA2
MTAAVRFGDYSFTYAGSDKPSLTNVTLDLPHGELVSVVAPQGAGKTTLLRGAAGLLGEIYEGIAAGSLTRASANRPGAFFDGYVQVTLAVETVREEIGLPLQAMGYDRANREARVEAVATELRIHHLLDRDVTALSGGEEKLVGIAASLVADTTVHVLDEPFEQLDVAHLAAVIRAAKVRARDGRLVIIATGSVDTAVNIADTIVTFDGAQWKQIARPTYGDVATISGLADSSLAEFLQSRSQTLDGVRRFRDGVRKVS